jgi:hypothetical protein
MLGIFFVLIFLYEDVKMLLNVAKDCQMLPKVAKSGNRFLSMG